MAPKTKPAAMKLVRSMTFAFSLALSALAQAPNNPGRGGDGPGGMGGVQEEWKPLKQFDKDNDKRLNAAERKAAREFITNEKAAGRGPRRPGFRGRGESQEPVGLGPKVTPADVKSFPGLPLYDLQTLRTFFLEFENADWEKELADFYHTDVEVPATLTVDGKTYRDVGVHFRGASSFFTVGEGRKRSLNLSFDFVHPAQQFGGYRTMDLLNSHTDSTYLRTVLYTQIAREYIPAAKANYVRVVINGESWGIYVNSQQFNKEFVKDWFGAAQGARWKVPGSPRGRGGLSYLGENTAEYKRIYEIKTKDDPAAWASLIKLCRLLEETPTEKLIEVLTPLLDIHGALKFLALENVLINNDGYWIRSSDYNLYQDAQGRFHIIPHDANETFAYPGGPGGGPRVEGVELDTLFGADDKTKPLLNRLLAVDSLRASYLGYVRDIATKWLDWNKLGPLARQYQALIANDVKADVHKLATFEAFTRGVAEDLDERSFRGPRRSISLKKFAEQRRAFLLNHPQVKEAVAP